VPQYYGSTQHNLWVKITNFASLPADWPLANLAPAGSSSEGMEASLNSRASLLYVRELNGEAPLEPITWWVNQGQTYLQERDGGYMWAPKRSKGAGEGPRPYWTTMTVVLPGDRIVHYRNSAIRAVSRATSAAEDTTRPGELPAEAWEHEGWLVRTEYLELVNPLRLDAIPETWLVPSSGPFNAVGRVQQGYLFKLSDDFGKELARMLSDTERKPGPAPGDEALDALARHTLMDKTELEELIELLETRKQLILQGPPGCGKTWIADALARHLTDNPLDSEETNHRMELVQFHQSYGYEDFMQGIRPITTDDGRIEYRVLPGILVRFIEQQGSDPSDNYVLVIDEINRGNISRIFGELLLLLEYRDKEVRLPYSESEESKFRLPKNLLIIGTMNTADRSLASIDYALRRRFAFQRLSPVERGKARVLETWLDRHQSIPRLRRVEVLQLFLNLNRRVEELMGAGGEDFQIGHSYFMTEQIFTERGRARVWRTSIRPLLEEYLANRKERTELLDQLEPGALLARPEEAGELEDEIDEDAE